MAAARWVGRGDKNGADGAAVNAMRTLINSVSMRGVVVIGEGEKDNAPMLFNGEEVGDGTGPGGRRRGGPDRRHPAVRQRHAERGVRPRGRRARLDVRPVRRLLHDQAGHRPRGGRRGGPRRAARGQHRGGRQGEGHHAARRHRGHPGPAAARGADQGGPRGGRPDPPDHRRRRGRRDHGGPPGHRHRPDARHRRHPRGHHRRLRAQVHGRRDPRQARAAGTRPSGARRSTPGTTSTGCSPPTTWSRRTTASSPPPASPTAS